jgi:hypothetical protein
VAGGWRKASAACRSRYSSHVDWRMDMRWRTREVAPCWAWWMCVHSPPRHRRGRQLMPEALDGCGGAGAHKRRKRRAPEQHSPKGRRRANLHFSLHQRVYNLVDPNLCVASCSVEHRAALCMALHGALL